MFPQTSPAKWTALFVKAVREGVQVRQLGSGAWVASSGTTADRAYEVALSGCECPGHQHHGRCKHRAMLAFRLGVLTVESPEPTDPAPAVPAAPCFGCKGSGREWIEGATGEWFNVACVACEGTGEAGEAGDDGDDTAESMPYDAGRGLTPAQVVALKADALHQAVRHGLPLVNPFTGGVVDRHNCRDAA